VGGPKSKILQRRKKEKVETFEKLEFFQDWEECVEAREEQYLSLDDPKRSRPLRVSCPRSSRRSA
jgi:hypothetical protein